MGTLENSEDSLQATEIHHNLETSKCDPLKYKMDYPIFNCIDMYRKINGLKYLD